VREISEKLHEFLEENFPSLQEDKVPSLPPSPPPPTAALDCYGRTAVNGA
jgi:hypothetical protein